MMVLFLSCFVVLLDQITKYLVRRNFDLGQHFILIDGFFDIRRVHNTGAAWGTLQGFNVLLVVLSFLILFLLIYFRRHFICASLLSRTAMGLIIGGIIGNLIDRIRLAYVLDFFDLHWHSHHFPVFNVADSAICIGVGFYMLRQILNERQSGS